MTYVQRRRALLGQFSVSTGFGGGVQGLVPVRLSKVAQAAYDACDYSWLWDLPGRWPDRLEP